MNGKLLVGLLQNNQGIFNYLAYQSAILGDIGILSQVLLKKEKQILIGVNHARIQFL
jgi:hypothetical protein